MNYKKTLVVSPVFYPSQRLPHGYLDMLETAAVHGIEITPIGVDYVVSGKYRVPKNNVERKIIMFMPAVTRMKGYDYVIMLDAADTLWATSLEEIHHVFAKFNKDFVISSECNCYPPALYDSAIPTRDLYPKNVPYKSKYLNAGFMMARWEAFVKNAQIIYAQPWRGRSDQACWTKAYVEKRIDVQIDYQCRLCQNLAHAQNDLILGRRPFNKITETYPCLFHGNGSGRSFLPAIKKMLFARTSPPAWGLNASLV